MPVGWDRPPRVVLGEVLLVVGVGVVRLTVAEQLRVAERVQLDVVHVDVERPPAVLPRWWRSRSSPA
jgi:hypothetical protein